MCFCFLLHRRSHSLPGWGFNVPSLPPYAQSFCTLLLSPLTTLLLLLYTRCCYYYYYYALQFTSVADTFYLFVLALSFSYCVIFLASAGLSHRPILVFLLFINRIYSLIYIFPSYSCSSYRP